MDKPAQKVHNSTQEKSEAYGQHRKDRFWQIIFPLFIASGIIVAAFIYLLVSESKSSEAIAGLGQTATVFLTLPMLILVLVVLTFLIIFIWLINRLSGWIPKASKSALNFIENVCTSITKITSTTVKPILFFNQKTAEVQQLIYCLRPKSKAGKKT